MIANALHAEIDRYAARALRDNPVMVRTRAGTMGAANVRLYLQNLHYLISHSPLHISTARARATARGEDSLSSHFAKKLGEETGHEVWAENDMNRLSKAHSLRAEGRILPAILELVAFISRIIEEDPALYLSYALFAEQATVLLGPAWLQLLEERCGIPRASMTVVANHAELDREHVEDALTEIDSLVRDPRMLGRMREVLLEASALFDQFCAQVAAEGAQDEPAVARAGEARVDAA